MISVKHQAFRGTSKSAGTRRRMPKRSAAVLVRISHFLHQNFQSETEGASNFRKFK